ncbi:MAG: carboxypeptidase regulatory-like domain-containing protein [Bacteroidia bacterium]
MKTIVYALLFNLLLVSLPANSAAKYDAGDLAKLALAKQKLYGSDYTGALNLYKEVLVKNPTDAPVLHYVGLCHYYLNQYDKAQEHFVKAKETNTNVNPETYYYLGKIYHFNGKFDDALAEFNSYKSKASAKDMKDLDADLYIGQCNNAKTLMASPVKVTIENMGPEINSKYADKTPCITADGMRLVFTTRRPATTDAPLDVEGDGGYFEDIYISSYDTLSKKWKPAEAVPGSINTKAHDAVTSISPDGKQIFIYKNDLNDAKSRGGDIFVSKIVNGKWRTPETMGKPINSTFWEGGACISPDGKTLFFNSERTGGLGHSDIWMIKRISKQEWGKPENLGAEVNSEYDEVGMFLAPDGKTLFFASNGKGSMGSYDIFKTVLENGKWTKPVNIGYPINSERSDGPFVLSANAATGYFASNRAGGLGESDIYKVDLLDYAVLEKDGKKVENNGLSIMKGTVRDGYEGYGLPDAELDFADAAGQKVASTSSNENGEYFITLKGGVKYTVTIKKKGFKDLSESFDLKLGTRDAYVMDKEFLLKK